MLSAELERVRKTFMDRGTYVYEWRSALSDTALSVLAALAAGWWPARTAARQEVATALAYE